MRRYLLALGVCAALVTPLVADYLVIRINLGADVTQSDTAGVGLGGGTGNMFQSNSGGRGGRGGAAGAGIGGPGGGGAGIGSLGGGANSGIGAGIGGPGGGAGGAAGIGGPGGGAGLGTLGGGPGGGAGRGGAAGIGGGGRGGQGAPGLGGGPLGGGAADTNLNVGLVTNKGDLFIVATEVLVSRNNRNPNTVILTHKWGQTVLNPETVLPERAVMQLIKVPSLETRLRTKRTECLDSGSKQYLKLAEWMLENWNMPSEGKFSMQTAFESYLNELNSLAANLNATDKARVDALLAMKAQISKPGAPPAQELELVKALMTKFGKDYKSMEKGHFILFYSPRDDKLIEPKLARLESAYYGIMYWFALQGRPLPVPPRQMVCVMAESPDKFQALHKMFDDAPMYSSDGFFSYLDNITILAPTRIDAGYQKFYTMAKTAENSLKSHNLDFKKLLSERTDRPAISTAGNDQQKLTDIVTGQIFALAANAALDEGEAATTTMEAFRQIVASTGYMPRSVLLPRSVREGLTSFFATPKSSGDHNLPALWSGIGGEHWLHLPMFRKLAKARESGENATVTVDEKLPTRHTIKVGKLDVLAVVTDRVFERAERANKDDRDFYLQKAQAESWALTYYLAKTRLPELKKFYDELAQMPRDLELSPEVLEQAFARAFNLFDTSGEKLDNTKVAKFEADWAQYMKFANLSVETAEKSGAARN